MSAGHFPEKLPGVSEGCGEVANDLDQRSPMQTTGVQTSGPTARSRTWFDPLGCGMMPRNDGALAQLGERLHGMQEVSGSIPLGSTIFGQR